LIKSIHKQYLPNLDALRFMAFLAVFMAHAYHPVWGGMKIGAAAKGIRDWMQVGVLGVNFFFVLSGFLISRLLLIEKEAMLKLNVFKYYVRRVLRIWPLYFIIIILTVVYYHYVSGYHNTHWWWIILFAANFHIIRFGFPYAPALANLWTISVEEQFYITFPWVLKFTGRRMLPYIYGVVIIASIVFRAVFLHHANYLYFHSFSIMGDFAIGALCAYISLNEGLLSRILTLPRSIITIAYIIIGGTLFFYAHIFNNSIMIIFERTILAFMFGFIILEQVFSVNSFFKAGNIPGFTYSGKISYGLYMYHAFALQIAALVLQRYSLIYPAVGYMFLFPFFGFIICYSISVISYELVEKKILALKSRFGTKV
jgi:peptidoglycan/LPS O-acetylase OafA/YrhL